MRSINTLKGIGFAIVVAALASGCAGGAVKISSAKSCAAHGGNYNAAAKTCTYAATQRSAQQICTEQGGWYDPTDDFCTYNP